jgi:N-acetylmuramoyl-L-alanine amidase
MDPRSRQALTRYGAPAAFLAAVTIAVILIKSGLSGSSGSTPSTVGALPTSSSTASTTSPTTTKLVLTTPAASTTTGTTTTGTTTPGAQYYVIQSGDTLGSVAQKYSTTVEQLLMLNPGVDPTALHIGQRIRVQ